MLDGKPSDFDEVNLDLMTAEFAALTSALVGGVGSVTMETYFILPGEASAGKKTE